MWFVFPQVAGLGQSEMSRLYAIASLDEARAYLDHPVLGPRLRECAAIVLATQGRSAEDIFGGIDAVKLRSSMTLFHRAAPDEAVFREVLDRFFGGDRGPGHRRAAAARPDVDGARHRVKGRVFVAGRATHCARTIDK